MKRRGFLGWLGAAAAAPVVAKALPEEKISAVPEFKLDKAEPQVVWTDSDYQCFTCGSDVHVSSWLSEIK